MRRFAFVLFFVSGALALVYEVVWLRLLVLVFGSTQFAVTSVLTAFMAGLAHAIGLSAEPAARAGVYMELGRAFYDKRMFGRAARAIRRAQELYPTPEGEVRLAGYEAAAAKAAESE
jgi:hypothetical protein